MPRTKKTQSDHDEMVLDLAQNLKSQGYKVKADHIEGYSKPPRIGLPQTTVKRIPDIFATKGNQTAIIEVETEDSKDDPEAFFQAEVFTGYAESHPSVKFKVVVA